MTHFVRTFSIMRAYKAKGLLLSKRFEIMEKLYTSKTVLKMAGGRMRTPHLNPLAINYRSHQKNLTYFSYFAPLILFFIIKRQSQKGGQWAMAQCSPQILSWAEGSCVYRSGTGLLIKLCHCFISIAAKNKIQETTLGNSSYYDNYKARLSITNYLALRNKYQKRSMYDVILGSMGGL